MLYIIPIVTKNKISIDYTQKTMGRETKCILTKKKKKINKTQRKAVMKRMGDVFFKL